MTTLREGIRVEPVYAARDFDPKTDRASAAVRGAAAQDRAPGWHRAMRYVGSDPKAIGDAIREDLAGGMDAVFLPFDRNLRMRVDPTRPENRPFIGQDGAALYQPDDMDLALHGVRANLKVLALDSGARLPLSVARFSSVDRLLLGVDPLGALARDGAIPDTLEGSIGRVAEVVRGVWASSALSSMTASSEPWEAAGANAVEQLAWSIATGAHYVQALCALGIPAAQAAAQVTFRVAIGRDIFTEIARLRALRLLWNMVRASLDIAGDAPVFVHAIGAHSTLSARDPWVNMLRATNETFAAIAGGADMITTRAFDEALGGGGHIPRRVARNTQIILDEECHLGQVIDPAGGSYYVETLTRSIARAAWEELQSVEALGGIVPAILSGALQSRCQQSWRARRDALAKRREVVTGVSEFANVGEKRPVVQKSEEAAEGRMAEFHATPGWEVSPPMVKAPKLDRTARPRCSKG